MERIRMQAWWVSAFAVALAVLPRATLAQDDMLPRVEYPELPAQATDAEGFVPHGWKLESEHRGDLDRDRRSDLLLVLRMQDPANEVARGDADSERFDSNPRMLAIAFANKAGGYRLALQDHALIPRLDNPNADDYLDGDDAVAIDRGRVRVSLHWWLSMGGWGTSDTTFTFRWQGGCFRLIGYDRFELQRNSGDIRETSVNYLTGKARVTTGTVDDDHDRLFWLKLPAAAAKPKCLQDIGNGFGFDPGIDPAE